MRKLRFIQVRNFKQDLQSLVLEFICLFRVFVCFCSFLILVCVWVWYFSRWFMFFSFSSFRSRLIWFWATLICICSLFRIFCRRWIFSLFREGGGGEVGKGQSSGLLKVGYIGFIFFVSDLGVQRFGQFFRIQFIVVC